MNPERLKEELADVLAYAFLLAEKHHLNILTLCWRKSERMERNIRWKKQRGQQKNTMSYDRLSVDETRIPR